jgi:cell division protein FtsL
MTPPATAAVAGGHASERARSAIRPPRRVSGPARRPRAAPAPRRPLARAGSPLLQLLTVAERLASHRLVDRLIRGRTWLVLVTSALIGVVTLQLALLKLNGGVGRTLLTQAQLQRENASLSIENSELAAADRVQTRAAQMGMEFASSAALRALAARPHMSLRRAASVLSAPVRSQTAGSEEGGEGSAQAGGGESSAAAQASEGSATQAGTSEGSPAGEARSEGGSGSSAGAEPGTSSGSAEAPAASQTSAHESEAAPASAGGQSAPESGSGG